MATKLTHPPLRIGGGVWQKEPHMHERSIREQVEDYLSRMRYTLPFPCGHEDAYYGCLPPTVEKWSHEGLFNAASSKPGRAYNMLSTMFAAQAPARSHRRDVLHISADDEQTFMNAAKGMRGYERIFWIEAPWHMPMPRNSAQTPFYLPDDHPHHDTIDMWVAKAFEIENEIQASLHIIERYMLHAKTMGQVRRTWPELLNFIHMKQIDPSPKSLHTKRMADVAISPIEKDALTTQLARAVMLPEKRPALTAWVRFYTPEIET